MELLEPSHEHGGGGGGERKMESTEKGERGRLDVVILFRPRASAIPACFRPSPQQAVLFFYCQGHLLGRGVPEEGLNI